MIRKLNGNLEMTPDELAEFAANIWLLGMKGIDDPDEFTEFSTSYVVNHTHFETTTY